MLRDIDTGNIRGLRAVINVVSVEGRWVTGTLKTNSEIEVKFKFTLSLPLTTESQGDGSVSYGWEREKGKVISKPYTATNGA
jgi:hypothetical protein